MRPRTLAGKAARAIKRATTRILQPLLRTAAQRNLGRIEMPQSVLFVCHGNICRSPYAAAAFVRALPATLREQVTVSSAGFIGPGRAPPAEALNAAAGRGLDLSSHQSVLISAESAARADLIVVMDPRQRRFLERDYRIDARRIVVLGDLDPEPSSQRAIKDPIGQVQLVFEESYSRIDRCLAALMARAYSLS